MKTKMSIFVLVITMLILGIPAMAQVDSTSYYPIGTSGDSIKFEGVWHNYPGKDSSTWYYSFKPGSGAGDIGSYVSMMSILLPAQIAGSNYVFGGTWTTKTARITRGYVGLISDSIVYSKTMITTQKFWFTLSVDQKITPQNASVVWGDPDLPDGAFTGTTWGPSQESLDGTFLPVELISFKGEAKDAKAQITWATASEINSDYFTLQRSLDGTTFEDVTKLPAMGNSNQVVNYSYADQLPMELNGKVIYYRLTQTDWDGRIQTFNIIPIMWRSSSTETKLIFNGTYYEIKTDRDANVRTTITGQTVKAKPIR